jgi:hypothetical protein
LVEVGEKRMRWVERVENWKEEEVMVVSFRVESFFVSILSVSVEGEVKRMRIVFLVITSRSSRVVYDENPSKQNGYNPRNDQRNVKPEGLQSNRADCWEELLSRRRGSLRGQVEIVIVESCRVVVGKLKRFQ